MVFWGLLAFFKEYEIKKDTTFQSSHSGMDFPTFNIPEQLKSKTQLTLSKIPVKNIKPKQTPKLHHDIYASN